MQSPKSSVFFHDVRIRSPCLSVYFRKHLPCTDTVYEGRLSPFNSVNDRIRSCVFDLGRSSDLDTIYSDIIQLIDLYVSILVLLYQSSRKYDTAISSLEHISWDVNQINDIYGLIVKICKKQKRDYPLTLKDFQNATENPSN